MKHFEQFLPFFESFDSKVENSSILKHLASLGCQDTVAKRSFRWLFKRFKGEFESFLSFQLESLDALSAPN